jgi:ribosomal protein S18 acetylase RimI-like enzyme
LPPSEGGVDQNSVAEGPRRAHRDGVVISYEWRGDLADAEMLDLVQSHGGDPVAGRWPRVREHSLGWVTARDAAGLLVGFVNVAWDGGDHAFLLDPKTRPRFQRRGIGTALVGHAVDRAREAGCEWLHVDFDDHLAAFYFDACGFRSTPAGLINLHQAE